MTDEVRDRIRGLLVKVGDERKKVVGNVKGLVAIIKEDITEHRDTILTSVIECGKYLPTKSGVYGTWLALMNPDNRVFVSECIASIESELRYAVKEGNLDTSLCLLRLLIECANAGCVSQASLVTVLTQLLRSSASAGAPEGTFGVYLVVASIPWFSPELALNDAFVSNLIGEVLSEAGAFVASSAHQARKSVVTLDPEVPDQLESTLESIEEMRTSQWESQVLIRPYLLDGLKETLSVPVAAEFVHSIRTDDSALFESAIGKVCVPQAFARTELPAPLSVSDRWVLEETLSETLTLFQLSVGECAKALLRVPFVHDSFEAVLADVLVSRAVSEVPVAGIPRGFYQSVAHRCVALQESLKPRFEQSVISMSRQELASDQQFALADLLAFVFLNNVQLDRLVEVSEPVIVKMLTLILRLGFINSVQAKLPEALHALLPDEPGQGSPFEVTDTYSRVKETVKIKDGSDGEVLDLLVSVEPKSEAFKLFAQALVENGSRTVTHMTRLIELYRNVVLRAEELGLVASAVETETILLATVIEFWTNNQFRLEKSCDQLLRAGWVQPATLVDMMSVDPESLSTYHLVEAVMRVVLGRHAAAKKTLAEDSGMETDELSRSLAQAEHEVHACAMALMEKSPESAQRWFVKTFHHTAARIEDHPLFKLF